MLSRCISSFSAYAGGADRAQPRGRNREDSVGEPGGARGGRELAGHLAQPPRLQRVAPQHRHLRDQPHECMSTWRAASSIPTHGCFLLD